MIGRSTAIQMRGYDKTIYKGRILVYLLIDPIVLVESDNGSVCLSAKQIGNSVRICGVFDDVGGHS